MDKLDKNLFIEIDKIQFTDCLGVGGSGEVWKGKYENKEYAFKKILKLKTHEERFVKEFQ